MVSQARVLKAVRKAEQLIARKKLAELKIPTYWNSGEHKQVAYRMHFVKKGEELAAAELEEMEREEQICNQCGIEYECITFIDDLEQDDL